MDLIPADILREISKYLRFEDKFECTLVCRNWYIAITFHGLLYNKIVLFEPHSLKDAVTTFKRPGNEKLAQTVQELDISFSCQDISLITIFTNLKRLTFGYVIDDDFEFFGMDPACDMAAYERSLQKLKYLEYIEEAELQCPLVMPLLKSPHKLVYLKHISYTLDSSAFPHREMQAIAASSYSAKVRPMIPLLKNAPNLTFLELKHLYITPFDLEEIHDHYAPHLTTLKLVDVYAGFDANTTQRLAKRAFPHMQNTKQITLKKLAFKVKSFTLEFDPTLLGMPDSMYARHINTKNLWLKYVAAKYPNLTELAIDTTKTHEPYLLKGEFDKLWVSSLGRLTHLTSYDMKLCQLSKQLLTAMDNSGMRLEKLSVYAYERTLGTQIKALEESAQRHTVKQLDIHTKKGNVTREGKVGSGILLLLPLFTKLKTLKMYQQGSDRQKGYEHRFIPHLIQRAPHLEHLLVQFVSTSRAAEQNLALPEHSNLKYLELNQCFCQSDGDLEEFSQTMNQYVFAKCPQLIKFAAILYPPYGQSSEFPWIWELILDRNPHLTTLMVMYQMADYAFHIVPPHNPDLGRWYKKQAFCYDKLRPICWPPRGTWCIRIVIPHSILLNKKKVVIE